MRVLVVLSSFFLGSSLAGNLLNKIIPDVDFDNEDCIGDACFLRNQVMNVDRSKTDPTTNLAYNERSLAYINTQNLLSVCLPGVAKESAADSFTSCTGKPMEEICVFAKRKWLVKDAQNETVADLAFLSTAFSGLSGGDEAVKKCMKIKEEEEATDDYYVYEYDYDYYDYYDYLEEAGGIEVRRKRDAGKGDKKGGKKGKGGKNNIGRKDRKDDKKNGKKDKQKNAGKGKNTGKNDNGNGKRGNKKDTRKGKNAKGKGNKGARNGKNAKGKNAKGKGNKSARNGKNAKGKKAKGKGNKGARNGKKDNKKGNKDGNGKKGKGKQDNKATERKFVKQKNPSKKPSKENEGKATAQLNKLGFSKMPTKSTLSELECIWGELEDLLVKCGENIISNSP